ncbi:MAG: M36 family metallopeptidase, partial [Myxococcales bacterium]|nr:M36 family metallopeptidase [Myxococcales bacterium]
MRSSALARLSACSTLLVTATLSAPALGFAPRATPWASTPERFLATQPDHPRAKVSAALVEAGLVAASFRPDGAVAFAYRAAGAEAQANLRPEAAGEAALVFGRAAAESFGVAPEALELASVHPLTGRTSVYLAQRYEGLPVRGGFLLVSFRGGVITSVRNELMAGLAVPAEPALDAGDAGLLAADAVRAWAPGAGVKGAPALVVWLGGDRPDDARLAWAVEVSAPAPRAELTVHVDALSGAVLAVDDALRFAEGEGRIRMVVHRVNPSEGSEPITVPFLSVGNQVTDGDGEIVAPGGQTVTYSGSRVVIDDQGGQQNERMQVNLAGPFQVYDVTPSNTQQADPFVHLNLVKAWASQLTPTLPWLSQRLTSNVNLNDTCNAYWDGETVNFFRSGGGCNNTGQISSIVYHEFGHGYHQNLTRNVVGSVGEGTGDFLAATVLDDPVVGRGFATNGGGIRRIDADRVYPDDYVNEVHEDGLIWASALWDLREAMMDKHGDWAGRLMVDRIFIYALALGPGLSTAYPSVLEADDDDGDVNNGTPNSCEINAIFNAHGLVDGGAINHSLVPTGAYARILHDAPGRVSADDKGEVVLTAGVENRASCGQVDLQNLLAFWAPGLEGGAWSPATVSVAGTVAQVSLQGLEAGATFRYRFELQADGRTFRLGSEDSPLVALVDPGLMDIKAEGFEAGLGEWTHGAVGSDLRDDWAAATPLGLAFDPYAAHGGQQVVGTDLGEGGRPGGTDGAAKAGRATFLQAPPVPTVGMENVYLELWQHHAMA